MIIAPAIAAAQAEGMHVSGPFAPDTVFMRARSKSGVPGEFDVVVAMYHDQGLIPVKYLVRNYPQQGTFNGLKHSVLIILMAKVLVLIYS